jgi:hypothetical protein
MSDASPARTDPGQEATSPLHIRPIVVPEARDQVFFFGSRPNHEQANADYPGHGKKPVRGNQRHCQRE